MLTCTGCARGVCVCVGVRGHSAPASNPTISGSAFQASGVRDPKVRRIAHEFARECASAAYGRLTRLPSGLSPCLLPFLSVVFVVVFLLRQVLIRGVAAFCALISFSCIAAANNQIKGTAIDLGSQSEEFLIFVGVLSVFLDLAFIVTYLRGERLPPTWLARLPLTELIISVIWTIMWFAGSVAVAAHIGSINNVGGQIPVSTFNGGVAFGFFACFLWAASSFFAFRLYRSGSGASGPMQYNDI